MRAPIFAATLFCTMAYASWTASVLCVPTVAAAQPAPAVFGPYAEYATGWLPHSIAIGDLNDDGAPDLAVANRLDNTISVLLGTGGGLFDTATDFATAAGPYGVASGDLNGDGVLDLVAACFDGNGVSLLIGHGDGAFSGQSFLAAGANPIAVAIADFNTDGIADMATANYGGSSVSVLLGTGAGGFEGHVEYAAGPGTWALAVGDLNSDGNLDIVTANEGTSSVSVLLGLGDGTFSAPSDYASIQSPRGVAIGDLNNDGSPDLVVGGVSVLLGLGDGTFAPKTDLAVLPSPFSAAIVDLNLDGNLDIAVADASESSVSIFLGSGNGMFEPRAVVPAGTSSRAVAFDDLDGDERPDMVVANEAVGTIWVRLNETQGPIATTTGLTVTPQASVFSEPLVLAATVTPDPGGGTIQFFNGSALLGADSVVDGVATLTVNDLIGGDHGLRAVFGGRGAYAASTAADVAVQVSPAPAGVSVLTSPNPSLQHDQVSLEATVTALPPAEAIPTGGVQFRVDGTNVGAPVVLAAGVAATTISTLSPGDHQVEAIYAPDDPLKFVGGVSGAVIQGVIASEPEIVAVRDVPNDQGGFVFVTWRCKLDQPGVKIVTSFRVWRRVPHFESALELNKKDVSGGFLRLSDGTGDETFWEAIADLPAAQLVSYGYTAKTTQDSIAGSNPFTAYFVQALTADPFRSFSSPPDSGYSVDNLAPPTPLPFTATYGPSRNSLHWSASRAPDLREFRLYRGITSGFEPNPSSLVAATKDTGYVDIPGAYFYKLTAVDVHGNQSLYATVSPDAPTATLASLVSVDALADRIRLLWYAGSLGGRLVSVYRRATDADWMRLEEIVVEEGGYLRFEDLSVVAGKRYGYRLGIQDGGEEHFVGEAWVTAKDPTFAIERVHPNPSRDGSLSVQFVLARVGTATLEVFDVGGRRVVDEDVGTLGPGRHVVRLGQGAKLSPGIYMVRLTQAGRRLSSRASVLK